MFLFEMPKTPRSSDYLEQHYQQCNQKIADATAALLKAQLKAGHHTLTKESWLAVVKKYDWQYCLPLSEM